MYHVHVHVAMSIVHVHVHVHVHVPCGHVPCGHVTWPYDHDHDHDHVRLRRELTNLLSAKISAGESELEAAERGVMDTLGHLLEVRPKNSRRPPAARCAPPLLKPSRRALQTLPRTLPRTPPRNPTPTPNPTLDPNPTGRDVPRTLPWTPTPQGETTPNIELNEESLHIEKELEESRSFPGLRTQYRLYHVDALVGGLPREPFETQARAPRVAVTPCRTALR